MWGGGILEGSSQVGKIVTVWDGEIRRVYEALKEMRKESRVLVMTDSQVAIVTIRKAGRTGTARTEDLAGVIKE